MLRMSKLSDYGTMVMAYMARNPGEVFKARELADATGVTLPTVSKILKGLARGKLLVSYLGAHGGYTLARDALDISVGEIISTIDGGPIGLTECSTAKGACDQEPTCAIRGNWQRINEAVRDALHGVSLQEFAQPVTQQYVDFGSGSKSGAGASAA